MTVEIARDLTELVGRTPLLQINHVAGTQARVLAKLESANPGGSIKDRTALSIVNAAEADGKLQPGGTIIEATSGNTGIALAWIGAVRGYRVIIVMPDDQSEERRTLLRALGAELVLTPGAEAMVGANLEARRIRDQTPGSFLAAQGANEANPAAHAQSTGPEIWAQTGGEVDIFIATVGTGGTITGTGQFLKEQNPGLQVIGVQPEEAAVLTGGEFHPHKVQGIIGSQVIPRVLDTELYDEVISVPQDAAIIAARQALSQEGLLVGISSGAALLAAREVAARPENAGKTIVTILADTGERYLSTELFDHARGEG